MEPRGRDGVDVRQHGVDISHLPTSTRWGDLDARDSLLVLTSDSASRRLAATGGVPTRRGPVGKTITRGVTATIRAIRVIRGRSSSLRLHHSAFRIQHSQSLKVPGTVVLNDQISDYVKVGDSGFTADPVLASIAALGQLGGIA